MDLEERARQAAIAARERIERQIADALYGGSLSHLERAKQGFLRWLEELEVGVAWPRKDGKGLLEELERVRREMGVTQKRFCELLGVTYRTYRRWFTGEKHPSSGQMRRGWQFVSKWDRRYGHGPNDNDGGR